MQVSRIGLSAEAVDELGLEPSVTRASLAKQSKA